MLLEFEALSKKCVITERDSFWLVVLERSKAGLRNGASQARFLSLDACDRARARRLLLVLGVIEGSNKGIVLVQSSRHLNGALLVLNGSHAAVARAVCPPDRRLQTP